MADAKKCDICGKYYTHYRGFNTLKFMEIGANGSHGNYTVKDCCPECMTGLTVYIDTINRCSPKTEE